MENKTDIIWLDSIDSTNDEARRRILTLDNLSVLSALEQTGGRGQRENKWHSEPNQNLTFSIVLKNPPVKAADQFIISEITAVTLVSFLAEHGIEADIKWPNDIYVGDRKICGILIENSLRGEWIQHSIIGIGLNVNQKAFSDDLPNPISMAQATGREFDREEVLQTVATSLMARYEQLREGGAKELQADYHQRLYRLVTLLYAHP